MRCIVLISIVTVVASGCAGGTTAPSTRPATAPSTHGNLEIISLGVSDAGQGARGDWQYKVTVRLRETGGLDITVTNIQCQALLGSNILSTGSVIPALSIPANSSRDAGLVFAADTHIGDLSALTVDMTVQFKDANGNASSASNSFSGFGYWDY
jgi:hypothetical protein